MKGKRWFYVLLAIWLLCGWAGWALGEDTLMVANPNPEDRLHLRAAPSTSAASLGKYYNGTCVAALQFHRNGWAEVQVGPLRGYMSMQYLSAELQASAMPAVEAPWQGIRLFALPDEQSTSQELPGYARMMVMGFSGSWCHVYVPGSDATGFIHVPLSSLLEEHATVKSLAWVSNPNSADRLNLRTKPSASAASLGKYYNGVQVEILELAKNGWVQVRIGELATGYMQVKYLSAYEVANVEPQVRSTCATQLCLQPRTGSKALNPILAGEEMTVLGVCSGWYHVRMENLDGYVPSSCTDTQLRR